MSEMDFVNGLSQGDIIKSNEQHYSNFLCEKCGIGYTNSDNLTSCHCKLEHYAILNIHNYFVQLFYA